MNQEVFSKAKLLALVLACGLLPASVAAEPAGQAHRTHAAADQGDADDPHAHHRAMLSGPAEAAKSADVDPKDLALVDQHGREVKLVSDVIGDRIVVMDFVYTTCTTVCPVLSAVLGQLQRKLGDQLGNDVALVSLTVDPIRDTPQRLRAYAAKHQARDGWVWLTGPKTTMDEVLDGLGAYSPNFENHPAMVLVGDGRTGEWSRFFGFPSPDRLMQQVNTLQAARPRVAGG